MSKSWQNFLHAASSFNPTNYHLMNSIIHCTIDTVIWLLTGLTSASYFDYKTCSTLSWNVSSCYTIIKTRCSYFIINERIWKAAWHVYFQLNSQVTSSSAQSITAYSSFVRTSAPLPNRSSRTTSRPKGSAHVKFSTVSPGRPALRCSRRNSVMLKSSAENSAL